MAALGLRSVIFIVFFIVSVDVGVASDPDAVQDFCVRVLAGDSSGDDPSSRCKNPSNVTVEDFIFYGIKSPGRYLGNGLSATSVNVNTFPGLNTQGMSFVRADLGVGGVNVPHFHPRATETAFVLEGKVYSGFVDSESRIFAKVIEEGEVMVFPKGLVHFQMNVGDQPATILGAFNSQNPGLMKLPASVFGSGIKEELLEKAFGMSAREVARLKKRFGPR